MRWPRPKPVARPRLSPNVAEPSPWSEALKERTRWIAEIRQILKAREAFVEAWGREPTAEELAKALLE